MPTINDIAVKLGVSKSTVSKALNNAADVSETLKKRILETAVEIGYEKNRIRKDSSKKLCILVENMDYENPMGFGYEIVIGFKQLAVPAGWEVDTIHMTEELQKMVSYDMFMLEHKYQGAFIVGFSLIDPWMKDFKSSNKPAVLYDNYIPENPRTAYVGVNNDEGFDMAIAHLKSLGHKTIGYLGGSLESHVTISRYNAYLHSMEKHGFCIDKSLTGCSYFISECTQKYLPVLLKKHVTV